MATNLPIENYVPAVKDARGIYTRLPVTLNGTAATLSVGGTLAVTGASTFTGVATFTASPVFTGGRVPNVVSGQGATVTLTAAQSGSVCLFDRAAGIVYTLPAPAVGLEFVFVATTTVTTNSYKVITDAGTTLLAGAILGNVDNTANKSWVGNGTNHIAVTQAAASTNATGGIIGSYLRFVCTTTLQWNVTGMTIAGGTPSTPFATS
jgi:hypothetical protein